MTLLLGLSKCKGFPTYIHTLACFVQLKFPVKTQASNTNSWCILAPSASNNGTMAPAPSACERLFRFLNGGWRPNWKICSSNRISLPKDRCNMAKMTDRKWEQTHQLFPQRYLLYLSLNEWRRTSGSYLRCILLTCIFQIFQVLLVCACEPILPRIPQKMSGFLDFHPRSWRKPPSSAPWQNSSLTVPCDLQSG